MRNKSKTVCDGYRMVELTKRKTPHRAGRVLEEMTETAANISGHFPST
jgi:hypothetical protein